MLLEMTTYLGPARVLETDGARVRVSAAEREVWATMAMGFEYRAEPDDILLTFGQGDDYFIVGILQGRGAMTLTAPGALRIHAPKGEIDLFSARGIRVRTPEFTLKTRKFKLLAQSVVEKFGEATRWVRDCFQLRAGRMRTVVKEEYQVRADRIAEWAKRDVKIDGNKIHLG